MFITNQKFEFYLTYSSIWFCLSNSDSLLKIFVSVCFSTMTELLALFIILLILFYFWRKIRENSKLPPGPYGLPILGYLPFLNSQNPQKSMQELSLKYGDVFSLQMGQIFCVVLSNQDLIKNLFSKCKLCVLYLSACYITLFFSRMFR